LIAGLVAAAALAACGGSSDYLTKGSSSGGTSSGGTTTTLSMGNGSGSSFENGVIALQSKSLSAGGSTSLQVSIVDQTGALYTTSTTITFNSPCVAQNLASITVQGAATAGTASITTTTGTAEATYAAAGCSGADVITASASANSQSLTATGTVTVAAAQVGSIQFISATPANIPLKGVGSATATVIFKVFNTSGGPSPEATVTFTPNTTVGGISISPASGVSDANGQVQTIVTGGTVATTVRITATTTAASGNSISTESSNLTVSTGIPTSSGISLAVSPCANVESYDLDGVAVPVTVRMVDRFNNPVADGTTANFRTTLPGITPNCTTAGGVCTGTWTSQGPYFVSGNPATTPASSASSLNGKTQYNSPPYNWCAGDLTNKTLPSIRYCNGTTNGRSPILVTAVGEESFIDANGNGIFDTGDTVAFDPNDKDNDFANGKPKPWFDTSEPFLNEWEFYDTYGTPTYELGEPFIDFNSNGTRDVPDGLFNGLASLCEGPLCAPAKDDSVAVYAENIIIESSQNANYTVVGSSFGGIIVDGVAEYYVDPAAGTTIQMYIYDENFQQMANTSTVGGSVLPSASFSSATVTVLGSTPWPCAADLPRFNPDGTLNSAGQLFSFTISPLLANVPSAVLSVSVQSLPSKVTTTFNIVVIPKP
jgi:hypothetical protein